jgi:hypothetical protein
MTAELFAVPFLGGCLSPLPSPERPAFKKGIRVAWQDGEEGTVGAVTPEALCVHWDASAYCWYPLNSLAAMERIAVLETEEAAP